MRVDQLVPAYHRGDAIGDTATNLRDFFRAQGFQSDIYCLDRDRGLEGESIPFENLPEPGGNDVTILHYALVSVLTEKFKNLKSRKLIIHHNITPHGYFEDYSREMARIARMGREELASLAPHVDLALADSEYNKEELLELGFKKADVLPLFIDFGKYDKPASPFIKRLFDDDRVTILFVGRIVPNKRIDELIKVAFYYKKYISPLVRLVVVGKTGSLPGYYDSLIRLADEFYLDPDEICFTGHISDEEMFALYRRADVFLSLSEHEGFGLPFIESLVFDLPIIAYDCTAVPFTLGGAGVMIRHKRVDYVAELVHKIAGEKDLRQRIIRGQRKRLEEFRAFDREGFLLDCIRSLTEGQ
jgi:glycosyltransferase involved in cell wall biosynthesis